MGSRFCKDGRSCWLSDVQAFLRYVDGKAAEGAFVQALDTEVKAIKQHKETRREYMTKETIARCARVSVEYVVELGKRNHLL